MIFALADVRSAKYKKKKALIGPFLLYASLVFSGLIRDESRAIHRATNATYISASIFHINICRGFSR